MDFHAITDRGIVRKQNQDACCAEEYEGYAFLLVCDGMGGAKAGDVASRLAVTVLRDEIRRGLVPHLDDEGRMELMTRAADTANSAVYELSISRRECSGMGTTVVSALVKDGEAMVLNIGDSRLYHISQGSVRQITRDHSYIEDMVERGEITREQSRSHPGKNLITRALGTAPDIDCDFFPLSLRRGDWLLLCSDGLSNLVTDMELLQAVSGGASLEGSCRMLLQLALERGAPDNVTVVLYRE